MPAKLCRRMGLCLCLSWALLCRVLPSQLLLRRFLLLKQHLQLLHLLQQLLDLLLLQPLLRCFLQPARLRLSLMRELSSLLRPQPGLELSGLQLAASWVP